MDDADEIKSSRGVQLVKLSDGRYLVIAAGEVLVQTKVESYATIEFEEAVAARDQGRERRVHERAFYDLQAMRSDSSRQRAANARRAGGKGGRGGV